MVTIAEGELDQMLTLSSSSPQTSSWRRVRAPAAALLGLAMFVGVGAASWHAGCLSGLRGASRTAKQPSLRTVVDSIEQKSWANLKGAVAVRNLDADEKRLALNLVKCLGNAKECRGQCLEIQSRCNTAWMHEDDYVWGNFQSDMQKCNSAMTDCGIGCANNENTCETDAQQ